MVGVARATVTIGIETGRMSRGANARRIIVIRHSEQREVDTIYRVEYDEVVDGFLMGRRCRKVETENDSRRGINEVYISRPIACQPLLATWQCGKQSELRCIRRSKYVMQKNQHGIVAMDQGSMTRAEKPWSTTDSDTEIHNTTLT